MLLGLAHRNVGRGPPTNERRPSHVIDSLQVTIKTNLLAELKMRY